MRLFGQFQKECSRKFVSTILHSPGPIVPETPDSPGAVPDPKPYILWFIKMQRGESCARSPGGLIIAATCKGMGEQDQVAQQEPRTAQERALELLRACLVRERVWGSLVRSTVSE
jgi:hypothetical protein